MTVVLPTRPARPPRVETDHHRKSGAVDGKDASIAFIVDRNGVIRSFSPAGATLLRRHDTQSHELPPGDLQRVIRETLDANAVRILEDGVLRTTVSMTPGGSYEVEARTLNVVGGAPVVLLLMYPMHTSRVAEEVFDQWGFTAREREIAATLVHGLSSIDICERLSISANTLKIHVRHILQKTNSHSRFDFLALVMRETERAVTSRGA